MSTPAPVCPRCGHCPAAPLPTEADLSPVLDALRPVVRRHLRAALAALPQTEGHPAPDRLATHLAAWAEREVRTAWGVLMGEIQVMTAQMMNEHTPDLKLVPDPETPQGGA